ncbi:hypothetical protein ACG94V_12530 [Acinetobacter sp. ULE_I001]|uniref:hypothetical protein n=1 Tax=unclassified Acinetobacter TaxID=196816 RepID=UPI003AF7568D
MPIETKDLVLYESERLSDNDDGGGKYNGQVIIDGQSNNLFNDISELDRSLGDVSMRKIFPAVTTIDTDLLMGSTVFISENPKDPAVSALLFSTGSYTDQRKSAQNRVESYLSKGTQIAGTPLDTLWQGMKQIQVCMFTSEIESNVGDAIVLVSNGGLINSHEQYVRILKVETRISKIVIDQKEIEYKIATYSISDPLEIDFVGLSAKSWYAGEKPTTIIRETLVADTGKYYSSTQATEDAQLGEFTVNVKDVFTQIIPSAQSETAIIDVNAAGEKTTLVPGNDGVVSTSYQVVISTSQNFYLGSSVMPSSLSFALFNQQVNDSGGLLKTNAGTQVGTIDYQKGLIQWTTAAGSGNTTLNIAFKPASTPLQNTQSQSIQVTQNNQGSNWTGVLIPPPAPGSVSVSFMVKGKFYELKDDGSGQLKAGSTSIGSGSINYETGSWLLTTGELADVGSNILVLWCTPISTFVRSNLTLESPSFELQLGEAVAANSVVVKWNVGDIEKTATSNAQGKFNGDATGSINYATGVGKFIPKILPQKGTVFTINYNTGFPLNQSAIITPTVEQELSFNVGTGNALQPGSIELKMELQDQLNQNLTELVLTDSKVDNTVGNLYDKLGNIHGTINYSSGAVVIKPYLEVMVYQKNYTPQVFVSN